MARLRANGDLLERDLVRARPVAEVPLD